METDIHGLPKTSTVALPFTISLLACFCLVVLQKLRLQMGVSMCAVFHFQLAVSLFGKADTDDSMRTAVLGFSHSML